MPEASEGRDPGASHFIIRSFKGHEKGISCISFSQGPQAGKYLASASADKTAKIWNSESGELIHTLVGHSKGLNALAWHPSDRYLATASNDFNLRLWDVSTGKCLRVLEGHTNYAFCCAFKPQGNMLVSGSHDETLRVWDVRNGLCIRSIPAHSDPVTSVEFNSDGSVIVSSSFDGLVRLWDTETGKCLRTIIDDNNPPVTLAKFSPNSRYILIASLDGRLKIWDNHKQLHIKSYQAHKNDSCCTFACFVMTTPGKVQLLTGSEDHSVYLYDLISEKVLHKLEGRSTPADPGEGHCDKVLAVASHPSKGIIASAGLNNDCTIKLWEIQSSAKVL